MQKKFIILALIVLIIVAGGVLVWSKKMNQEVSEKSLKEEVKIVENTDTNNVDTSDWKTYRNEEFGFEVRYPSIWEMDIQSSTGSFLPTDGQLPKRDILNNKNYSIGFSFGTRESKAGGYITGITVESSKFNSVNNIIQKDYSWEEQSQVILNGQPMYLLCWKTGCKHGETGIDKRLIFEKNDLIWQIFGSVSDRSTSSKEDVKIVESFFNFFKITE
jgi:hypothetical protein